MTETLQNSSAHEEFLLTRGFGPPLRSLRFEADVYDCEVVGRIPEELNGSYYRLGPDRAYPTLPNDVLINGDGVISSFRFENGYADFRCRYVKTERLLRERAARRRLYGKYRNAFTDDPSTAGTDRDNTGNTNAFAHNGRLFALREDSPPYEIDPATLETLPRWTFDGKLESAGLTAHPKIDPITGEWWSFNFFSRKEYRGEMMLHVIDKDGNIYRQEEFQAPYPGTVHDFAVTREHVIFPVMPATVDVDRMRAGGDFYAYDPSLAPMWGIMRRDEPAASIRWFRVPESFIAHTMGAYTEGNKVHVDAPMSAGCSFPFFNKVDGTPCEPMEPSIVRITFDLDRTDNNTSFMPIPGAVGELPRIDERFLMSHYRYGWTSSLGGIARVDWQTGDRVLHDCGIPGRPQEPIFVPRSAHAPEGDGFVLAVVNRGQENRADLIIIDAQRMTDPPLATVRLPFNQYSAFHGSYVPA